MSTGMNTEYFVSHCVMTEECNFMGHSFLLISCLDHAKGKDARVEILEAIGFYSTKGPIIGFKLKGPGRVKVEDPKYFVDRKGIYHKTYQISETQLLNLFKKVNEDRRLNLDQCQAVKGRKEGGPYFNAYRAFNCKNYVLTCLESIGIEIKDLCSIYQIPKLSNNHQTLRLTRGKTSAIFWDSLLIASGSTNKRLEKNQILYEGIKSIEDLLSSRQSELISQNKKSKTLDNALQEIQNIKTRFEKDLPFPNRLDDYYAKRMFNVIERSVKKCAKELTKAGHDPHFIRLLLDRLKELLMKLGCMLFTEKQLHSHTPNSLDARLIQNIKNTQGRAKCHI